METDRVPAEQRQNMVAIIFNIENISLIGLKNLWRFITLIYMQNDREVEIDQLENDLRIQRLNYNEAHC